MRIANLSKKKSLLLQLEIADSGLARMRGLMFRPKVVPILFIFDSPGIFPIHSHFCPGEFDAIYVDAEGKVTEIFARVPVGLDRVTPKKIASYLLELPPEITRRLKISAGDRMQWR